MVLNVLLTIYGCFSVIGIAFMGVLHLFHDSRGFYKTAIGIWVGIFLAFMADGFLSSHFDNIHHIFGIPFISITMYCLAKLTSDIYDFSLPYKKLLYFSGATWLIGASMSIFLRASFALTSLIICLGIIAPTFLAVYKLYQLKRNLTVVDRLFSGIIIAEALHMLDYPFLRNIDGAAVFGFSFGLLLIYFVSVLVPVVILKRLSEEWSRSLEAKIEERSAELTSAHTKMASTARLAALGEMASGVAHEINTPLAIIKSHSSIMSELLQDPDLDRSTLIKNSQIIEKTTDRIARIVHGLRTFSRDGTTDDFEKVNVARLLEDTLGLCSERFRQHQIKLIIEDFSNDLHFEGKTINISQVLLNLLNNAHDAVAELAEKWVRVVVLDHKDTIEIRVIDSGRGVPPELHEKIFRPFFTTKEVGKGTGLGLSISLGIVAAHGGQLKIDSTCPTTCFSLTLPKLHKSVQRRSAA